MKKSDSEHEIIVCTFDFNIIMIPDILDREVFVNLGAIIKKFIRFFQIFSENHCDSCGVICE